MADATEVRPLEEVIAQERLEAKDCLSMRRRVRSQTRERRRLEDLSPAFAERFAGLLPPDQIGVRQGLILWLLARREAAVGLLEKHAKASPLASFILGLVSEERDDMEGALGRYREAAERGLASPELSAKIVSLLRRLGRRDEALAELEGVRSRFGGSPDLLAEEGACLEEEGEPERALALYERAMEIDATHPASAFRAAALLDLRGRDEDAMRYYRICTGTTSSYANAMLNLGLLHEDRRETEEAVARYRAVLRVEPNHVRARLFLRGALASLEERYDEAERKETERRELLMRTAIADFDLSVRSRDCLTRMNILTIGDLIQRTESELLAHRNFGETSLREIRKILDAKGLSLGMGREEAARRRREARLAEEISPERAELLARPISSIDLSVRCRKCMSRLGAETIGDLAERSESELMAVKNFGQTSLSEIRQKLGELGLRLRPSEEEK